VTTSEGVRPNKARHRLFWSLLASVVLNVAFWIAFPHHRFDGEQPRSKVVVSVARIEHRAIRLLLPRRPPPPQIRPLMSRSLQPTRPASPRPLKRKGKIIASLIPQEHPRNVPPHVRLKRSLPRTPRTKTPRLGLSTGMSFKPHPATTLKLPSNWATQDQANGAAANTSLWLDFKKARGAFVPRVFIMHMKTKYLSGPTLKDAVHDIVASLEPDDARVSVSAAQRVCGGKFQGWFLSYERPGEDLPGQYENILFVVRDTVYRVVYSRPDGQAEDPETRAALNSVCPS